MIDFTVCRRADIGEGRSMPIYEYACESCQEAFELLLRRRDERPVCPQCGSGKVRRKLSGFAAHVSSGPPCRRKSCPATDSACAAEGACPLAR